MASYECCGWHCGFCSVCTQPEKWTHHFPKTHAFSSYSICATCVAQLHVAETGHDGHHFARSSVRPHGRFFTHSHVISASLAGCEAPFHSNDETMCRPEKHTAYFCRLVTLSPPAHHWVCQRPFRHGRSSLDMVQWRDPLLLYSPQTICGFIHILTSILVLQNTWYTKRGSLCTLEDMGHSSEATTCVSGDVC